MPYPSLINRESIVTKARDLIETDGIDNLSLRALAEALGVRAPSLYRYVRNKTALIQAVNEGTMFGLVKAMQTAAEAEAQDDDRDATQSLMAMARTYRQYAHDHPACYVLAYSEPAAETLPAEEAAAQAVQPLQAIFAQVVGDKDALMALRGAYAFLHGWVMVELTGQFRRGGDLNADFENAYRAYIIGLKALTDAP